jgi:hypothetical protein
METDIIVTTNGYTVLIDKDDNRLKKYKWYGCIITKSLKHNPNITRTYVYARRTYKENGKIKQIYLHREIMGFPLDKIVDHKNTNTLDCRKTNLRICTRGQNAVNSSRVRGKSKYKGVHSYNNRWRVSLKQNGKVSYHGTFDNEVEAAIQYDKVAQQYWGQFAYKNFP